MARTLRKALFGIAAFLFGLAALVAAMNFFYNLAGLAGIQDGASGSRSELLGAVAVFGLVLAASALIAFKFARSAVNS